VLARILREPLVHFLTGGALLFALHGLIGASDGNEIVVDRARLLSYLQYKTNVFQPELASAGLDGLSRAQLDALVRAYIEEEMLFREARSYGLERGDEFIRQRLVQNALVFLASERAEMPPGEDDLRSYYAAHRTQYVSPASVTFTHVFFDAAVRGVSAERAAREAVEMLNRKHASFADAPAHGDRFAYLVNYVDRPADFVASQLGEDISARLMMLEPSASEWRGPYRSSYGWHVVLLVRRSEARQLGFEEVRAEVTEACLEEQRMKWRREALERLRGKYPVTIRLERADAPRDGR
jgi:parvulin-like peptidyl-prolyl isomerase